MALTKLHATQYITNDGTAVASAENAGKFRYYTDAEFSYLEVCMQEGAGYNWFLISQQSIL